MSDFFESIKAGLEEAVAHAEGKASDVRIHPPGPVDVKIIRRKTGLTQRQFAAVFHISLGTLRHWERGDRRPRGPALVLLNAVDREPETICRILSEEPIV
jgi:putative transcriptional regulator